MLSHMTEHLFMTADALLREHLISGAIPSLFELEWKPESAENSPSFRVANSQRLAKRQAKLRPVVVVMLTTAIVDLHPANRRLDRIVATALRRCAKSSWHPGLDWDARHLLNMHRHWQSGATAASEQL
jgi:hypothetical protein